jgi:hypothetical protein
MCCFLMLFHARTQAPYDRGALPAMLSGPCTPLRTHPVRLVVCKHNQMSNMEMIQEYWTSLHPRGPSAFVAEEESRLLSWGWGH